MRDEIGFESYVGSLRGARGTLWSKAGNALDKASLLIGLLRVSGIPARYVQGTLNDDSARNLVASMFSPPTRVVGCPPEGAVLADPVNDPSLLAEAKNHFWVEFNMGGGFVTADPMFRDSQIGAPPRVSADISFNEVPDSLRHKVTVRLKVEFSSAFNPSQTQTVLEETFITAALFGKPLTVGHFVSSSGLGGLLGSSITHKYSPYILIGQNDSDITNDPVIRGTDYQEISSSAFGSLSQKIILGVFLKIDVLDPNRDLESYERTLVDRIGFANRNSGKAITLTGVDTTQPALSNLDLITVNVLPGLQSLQSIANQKDRLDPIQMRLNEIEPLVKNIPESGPETQEQQALLLNAIDLGRKSAIVSAEVAVMSFAGAADYFLDQLERGYLTKGYYTSPRLILSLITKNNDNYSFQLDLLKNNLRTVPIPGQLATQGFFFEIARGLTETAIEDEVLSSITASTSRISTLEVFKNLPKDASFVFINKDNLYQSQSLNISEEAKLRITQGANSDKIIIIPDRAITVNDSTTVAWLEIDTRTGHTIGVSEDGGHFAEYVFLLNFVSVAFAPEFGFFAGLSKGAFIFLGNFLKGFNDGKPFAEIVSNSKKKVYDEIANVASAIGFGFFDESYDFKKLTQLSIGFVGCFLTLNTAEYGTAKYGFADEEQIVSCLTELGIGNSADIYSEFGTFGFLYNLGVFAGLLTFFSYIAFTSPIDPPVFPFIATDLATETNLNIPSTSLPVNLQIVQNDFFTVFAGDIELPTVFKIYIQNQGPQTDTFEITFPSPPLGFTLQSSIPRITLPAGEIGEVGVCLRPLDNRLDASSTTVPFAVRVTSTTNPAVTAIDNKILTVPDLVGITLTSNPTLVSTTPGAPINATLTVKSTGNVAAQNIPLTLETSNGLTVTGLPATVSLSLGESKTFPLTLTPAANTLNNTLNATITASFGRDLDGNPYKANAVIAVSVRSAEVLNIQLGAIQAAELGNPQLAQTLNSLAETTAQLQQKPDDTNLCGRVQLQYAQLLQLASVNPSLAALQNQLQTQYDLAGSCNTNQLLTSGQQLFSNLMAAAALQIALAPASATLEPGQGTTFHLRLENKGSQPATFNLSVDNLPVGVTATLNHSSVTVGAGDVLDANSANPVTLTLSQTLTTSRIFPVQVLATLADASVTFTASGLVRVAPSQADVVGVTADPVVIDQTQTTTNVSARILNTANLARSVQAQLEVVDQTGTVLQTLPPVAINLAPSTEIIPVNLGTVSVTGLNNGIYRLRARLLISANQPLLGRSAETLLFVGMPIKATVRTEPTLVAPGNPTVKTIIEVAK